jgi:cell division septation protein DedD
MRLATGILLWTVAAAAATAVALVAVSAIGTDIFGGGQDPLSQSEVSSLLASPTPSSTTSTSPVPKDTPTVTEGGTVLAHCTATGLVEIVTATPAQGYAVDSDDDLEDHPSVTFSSPNTEIEVKLRCVNGTPEAEITYDD